MQLHAIFLYPEKAKAIRRSGFVIDKVCPVVLRNQNQEILLFKHPLAGVQLVKGTIEVFDESYIIAAKRELAEESGITHVRSARYLCSWDSGFQNQVWHFVLCECADLANSWLFHTQDDGGHDFAFFWHDVESGLPANAHTVFQRGLEKVRELINQGVI